MSSSRTSKRIGGLLLAALLLAVDSPVSAGPDRGVPPAPIDLPGRALPFHADSGKIAPSTEAMAAVWEIIAGEDGASWIRVFFGEGTRLHRGSQIRITSLDDGAVQHLDAQSLGQWRSSSAYFNGSQVLVELLASSGGSSRVVIDGLWTGMPFGPVESLCGSDNRVLSGDARAGRMLSGGCTGWLINECFLSAGHCMAGNTVVQFNVPLSSGTGSLNHPPPADQYTIDTSSRQFVNGGIGNDWGYFGVFPNTETGLTALEAQGAHYLLATEVPEVAGQTIRITGFGTDSTPPESNQVQQTNAGPYREIAGTVVRYETDTTGGNSGSAVLDESAGRAIGIHTHAGCDSSPPPYNQGTALNNAGLQQGLRNPQGRCAAQAACNNNGLCDPGEDCFNCVTDCGHAPPGGGGAAVCGNSICEVGDGEDCASCPSDCNSTLTGKPSNRYCCGDDVGCGDARCTGSGNTCNPDPGGTAGSGYCCGDGLCESDESTSNCAVDCASTCSTAADCDDFNDCTSDTCDGTGTCQNTPLTDGAVCDAGAGLCCSAGCTTATCTVDADCDDGDACTDDACLNPGSCAAQCDNVPSGGAACCVATHSKEKGPRCSDGIDNDCDGAIDAADPDC